ncbi:DUF3239 domain-containing protein [Dysgonomonas sp. 511]|uniref:DUF3239 domain-containing protein n=1 Tax=Dysgonomonas sp. 511 TaxID=2302930 RepID=UPI0013D3971A|nr:DUF3239 domain-containing protein [Dysgonomonas sp. 511]NDV77525.1 DUF3239 domain-containing protein [Dysgonomonas sp. 511]
MENTQTKIGQEGDTMNFSYATRAMNINPDTEQIEKYDEYPTKGSPLQYTFIFLTVLILGGAIYLFVTGHWILGIVGVLATLIFTFLSYAFNSSLRREVAYKDGLLIPAIITSVSPLEILALADVSVIETSEPIYGVRKMKVNNLPNQEIVKGEKVPCAALFGAGHKGYRRMFEPRPICWGYSDKDLIAQATQAITEDKPEGNFDDEWAMLSAIEAKYVDIIKDEDLTFFDKDLNLKEI